MMIKLKESKKAVMADWFQIVFAVLLGAIAFAGIIALSFVSDVSQKKEITDIRKIVVGDETLLTYLRTPIEASWYSDDEDRYPTAAYLSEQGTTIAQLIMAMQAPDELRAMLDRKEGQEGIAAPLPPMEEQVEAAESILKDHTLKIFNAAYDTVTLHGKGWKLDIIYPEISPTKGFTHGLGPQGTVQTTEAILPTTDGTGIIVVRLSHEKESIEEVKKRAGI